MKKLQRKVIMPPLCQKRHFHTLQLQKFKIRFIYWRLYTAVRTTVFDITQLPLMIVVLSLTFLYPSFYSFLSFFLSFWFSSPVLSFFHSCLPLLFPLLPSVCILMLTSFCRLVAWSIISIKDKVYRHLTSARLHCLPAVAGTIHLIKTENIQFGISVKLPNIHASFLSDDQLVLDTLQLSSFITIIFFNLLSILFVFLYPSILLSLFIFSL